MKEINLRDYYPFYTKDVVVEVPDEVALLLREYELLEEAYRIRTYRYRAFYSLDYEGGIERDMASLDQKSPYEIVEKRYDVEQIYKGLAALPEVQRNRIYAHYFLGMGKSAIARAEGINESSVRKSIEHGLRNLEKILKEIF
ncbi:MAG: sigma-70 family RNA polymerase sigma factor [Lachnospiraceae bacterium]|nr:sigma-70 family RNA polymerase sigma factor [Lachnospiraceae bacterium]